METNPKQWQPMAAAAITPRVLKWLKRNQNAAATVLHVSPQTCNLVDHQGDILSLVTPDIGRGPFAVVVPVSSFEFSFTIHHSPFTIAQSPVSSSQSLNLSVSQSPSLSLPPYLITTDQAELWEPRPQWDTLRPHLPKALPWLRLALLRHTPTHAAAVHQHPRFVAGVQALSRGWQHQNGKELEDAVDSLAGLGPGLTPAGDDGLMGVLYGAWATQAQPDERLLRLVGERVRGRTTTLSRAFLDAAADGEAVQAWHGLSRAIAVGEGDGVYAAAKSILSIGDSSGACALTGFITMIEVSPTYL